MAFALQQSKKNYYECRYAAVAGYGKEAECSDSSGNQPSEKKKIIKDFVLNVSFKDALIRVAIALFLSLITVVNNTHLILYIAPVVFYLFVSALIKFCIVKYAWRRYIEHKPARKPPKYGTDPNYPDESV